ncbi:MAG: hypothetical protein ACRC8S_03355 [Fimbriiglobus sp.]
MKPGLKFVQLEDRLTPALNVLMTGGDLLITGTPVSTSYDTRDGGWNEEVSIIRTEGDNFQVKDGTNVLGTYNVSGNLTLDFDSINNDVVVDLNGGTLKGNLSVDLGLGDIDTDSDNYVSVINGAIVGDAKFTGVAGDLTVALGIPIERTKFFHYGYIWLYDQGLNGVSPVTVGKGVKVESVANGNSYDEFQLGGGSTVGTDVLSNGVRTTISGTVARDAIVRGNKSELTIAATGIVGDDARVFSTGTSADSKMTVAGKVAEDIQVESTGAAKATISGTVQRDTFVRANKADLTVTATGTVGDDARVFAIGSEEADFYSANLTVAGKVGDDTQVESSGAAKATISGSVMGDASVQASNLYTVSRSVSAFMDVTGLVGQDVSVNVVGGGPVWTTIAGTVNGNVAVKSTNSTSVRLDVTASGQVGKDLTLDTTTDSGRVNVIVAGKVNKNVVLQTEANVTDVTVTGQVVGGLSLTDGDGRLTVSISDPALKARAVILPGEGSYTLN